MGDEGALSSVNCSRSFLYQTQRGRNPSDDHQHLKSKEIEQHPFSSYEEEGAPGPLSYEKDLLDEDLPTEAPTSVRFDQPFFGTVPKQQKVMAPTPHPGSTTHTIDMDESLTEEQVFLAGVWAILIDTLIDSTYQDCRDAATQIQEYAKHREKIDKEYCEYIKEDRKNQDKACAYGKYQKFLHFFSFFTGVIGAMSILASSAFTGNAIGLLKGGKLLIGPILAGISYLLKTHGYGSKYVMPCTLASVITNMWAMSSFFALFKEGFVKLAAQGTDSAIHALKILATHFQMGTKSKGFELAEKQSILNTKKKKNQDKIRSLIQSTSTKWEEPAFMQEVGSKQIEADNEMKARILRSKLKKESVYKKERF